MLLALFAWPAFLITDVYLGVYVYPGAPLLLFAGYRLLGEIAIFWLYRLSFREDVTSHALKVTNAAACALCSVLIAIMGLRLGGISTPYIHGLSLLMFVIALAVPAPWRDTLWYTAPSVASFPLALTIASFIDPEIADSVRDHQKLSEFIGQYVHVFAAATIAAVSGQISWSARQQLQKARRLGRYRLEARIGEGGMNQVWLAWDESLKRNVALKILHSDIDNDARVMARFEKEALALSRLTSPNTVRIFDFGASDDGISFIAMEYLPGADLQQLVKESGPMPPERALALIRQACRSLAEAHAAGIIHRDIKPANLIATHLGEDYDVLKVFDFGIARFVSDATRTQSVRGTPAYMAPECWFGAQEADARSDIYALGATLYFLLTGVSPFHDVEASELVRAHALKIPEPPSAVLREPLPSSLDALVLRCLAKSPADRFANIEELETAIDACAGELPNAWTHEDARLFWATRDRLRASA